MLRSQASVIELIPLARPVIGELEEEAVLEVLRSRHLSLGPRVPAFEEAFAARVGAPHASAVSSGTAALHLALRAVGVQEGDEVITSPFSFVASANSILFERAKPVFVDIDPRDAEPRRRRRRRRDHRAHDRACCRSTSSATRPTRPRSSATACRSSRTRARRSAPCMPTACRSAAAAIPPRSASTPTSSSSTGEGGMLTHRLADASRRSSTPSATRAARPTWAGSTTTGSASTTA